MWHKKNVLVQRQIPVQFKKGLQNWKPLHPTVRDKAHTWLRGGIVGGYHRNNAKLKQCTHMHLMQLHILSILYHLNHIKWLACYTIHEIQWISIKIQHVYMYICRCRGIYVYVYVYLCVYVYMCMCISIWTSTCICLRPENRPSVFAFFFFGVGGWGGRRL